MKLKFDFDYQQLPHLVGKAITGISFGIDENLHQFVNIELDDGTELQISELSKTGEMELELNTAEPTIGN